MQCSAQSNFERRVGACQKMKQAVFAGEKRLFAFGDHTIKPYIPRIWIDFLDFLALIRNADEFWSNPMSSIAQECETTIVITTSHPDAIVVSVECNQWRDDYIKRSRVDEESSDGFPDTERIALKFCVGRDFAEQHLRPAAQNRYENALVRAPCSRNDFVCINLVVHRQEATDLFARCIFAAARYSIANDP